MASLKDLLRITERGMPAGDVLGAPVFRMYLISNACIIPLKLELRAHRHRLWIYQTVLFPERTLSDLFN